MYRSLLIGLSAGLLFSGLFACQPEYQCVVDPNDAISNQAAFHYDSLNLKALHSLLDSLQSVGADPNQMGEVLYYMGKTYKETDGDSAKYAYYARALEQFERGDPLILKSFAQLSVNLANKFLDVPDKQDSLILLTRSAISRLDPYTACPKANNLSIELHHYLGVGLRSMGDYDAALYYLTEGARRCNDPDATYWRCGRLMTELGRLQMDLGLIPEAYKSTSCSDSLFNIERDFRDDGYIADNFDTQVAIAITSGQRDKLKFNADSSYAYNLMTRPQSGFMGHSYNNLALSYIFEGDYDRAELLIDSAMTCYRNVQDDYAFGSCYENLSYIALGRGDTSKALTYLDAAEIAYHGDPARPAIAYAVDPKELKDPLIHRAELSLRLHASRPGRMPLSEVRYRVARVDSVFTLLQYRVGSERSKRQNIQELREFYENVIAFGYHNWQRTGREEYLDLSQVYLERSKGRILRERRRNTFAGLEKDGGRASDAIFAARSRLLRLQDRIGRPVADLTALYQDIRQAESALRELVDRGNKLGAISFLSGATSPRLAALAGELEPGSIVLDYLLGDGDVFVSYVTATERGILKLPANAGSVVKQVSLLKASLEGGGTERYRSSRDARNKLLNDYRQSATRLYDVLLRPVLDRAPGVNYVTVIPDGQIGYVPFAALLSEQPADLTDSALKAWPFALRSLTFNYEFSVDLWTDRNQRAYTGGQGTLLVSPEQQQAKKITAAGFAQPQRLGKLDPTEADALSNLLNPTNWSGPDARKLREKRDFSTYGILHFSGHGLASALNVYQSILVLDIDAAGQESTLSLPEIEALPLNVQLLVLSACQTGVGEVAAEEGVISLGRAGAIAGARSVVTSLWYVNQRSKADLFARFYKELAAGKSRSRAMRTAQLGQLDSDGEFAHPYYWAAFLHTGDAEKLTSDFFTGSPALSADR